MIPACLIVMSLLAAEAPEAPEAPDAAAIGRQFERTKADEAVDKALEFLSSQQKNDGSFPDGYGGNTGIASLCALAFLANGHTPDTGKYQDAVRRAVEFVLSKQHENGLLAAATSHGPMYSHGISTIMLSEVYGMTGNETLKPKLEAAIELILKAQLKPKGDRHRGGWRYKSDSYDSDISCTGWQLVALRAARNCGLDVPKSAIEEAVAYIERCYHPGGGFTYQGGGGPNRGRTGTGMLSLQLCGQYKHEYVIPSAEWLMKNPPHWGGEHFFYAMYYASQAMFQCSGKYWDFWKPRMESLLVEHQNENGSWPQVGSGHGGTAGECYRAAMCALALSIQYRYLPIYQR